MRDFNFSWVLFENVGSSLEGTIISYDAEVLNSIVKVGTSLCQFVTENPLKFDEIEIEASKACEEINHVHDSYLSCRDHYSNLQGYRYRFKESTFTTLTPETFKDIHIHRGDPKTLFIKTIHEENDLHKIEKIKIQDSKFFDSESGSEIDINNFYWIE